MRATLTLNGLIKEDIKQEIFQNRLSIKKESFLTALVALQTHKQHLIKLIESVL